MATRRPDNASVWRAPHDAEGEKARKRLIATQVGDVLEAGVGAAFAAAGGAGFHGLAAAPLALLPPRLSLWSPRPFGLYPLSRAVSRTGTSVSGVAKQSVAGSLQLDSSKTNPPHSPTLYSTRTGRSVASSRGGMRLPIHRLVVLGAVKLD